MVDAGNRRDETRARIVAVAAELLRERGPAAVTTRGVAGAAGVQAPMIYRLFGDKDGLLEAAAEHVMAAFVTAKAAAAHAEEAMDADPLLDLRAAWLAQIDFGVANPGVVRLLSDPARVLRSPSSRAGRQVLAARVHRVAAAGHLQVSEQRAVDLIQAAGIGVIQTLLAASPADRDPGLADAMLGAVLGQVVAEAPLQGKDPVLVAAVGCRAVLPALGTVSEAERQLLAEWLDREITARERPGPPRAQVG